MKTKIVLFILIFLLGSCKKTENKELYRVISNKSIFSPTLEREILKMIEIKNRGVKDKSSKPRICKVIIFQDVSRDGICVVRISWAYNGTFRKIIQFTPPSDSLDTQIHTDINLINGYTFLGKELISCCLVSESCNYNLINEKELLPVTDSIPGYPNISDTDLDGNYDAPVRIYKIVSKDSLQLIKSELLTSRSDQSFVFP
jgi:hypothetical protein